MLPTLYFVAVTTSACILAVIAVFIWTQRHRPGAWPMLLIVTGYMFAMMLHTFSLISETATAALRFNLAAELAYLTHPVHVLWLAFAVQRRNWQPARVLFPLYAMSMGLLAVAWTNDYHGWFVVDYSIREIGQYSLLSRSLGWWYNITSIFALTVQLAAMGILVMGIRSVKGRLRQRLSLVLIAVLIPLATLFVLAIIDAAGADPIIRYPARMGAMMATSLVLAYVFVRYQPLNLTPIALPLIFSEIPDSIIIVDEDGYVTDLNQAACSLKGMNEREAIGQSLHDLFPELTDTDSEEDVTIVDAQGRTHYFSWSTRNLQRRGEKIGTLYGLRDVTQHRHIEEQLREDEAHLRSLIQTETAFVIRTDMQGRYTYVNAAFAKWLGYEPDALIGMSVFDTIDVVDHEKSNEAGYTAIQCPGEPVRVSLTKVLADGSKRQAMWEYIAMVDGDDKISEIQCMGFDVTEQQEAQAREIELRMEKERRQLLTTFFKDAAHEFRTPLMIISSNAYLMSRLDDPERRAQKREQISANIQRMTQLLDSLLMMTRLETNGTTSEDIVDVGEALASACETIRAKYPAKPGFHYQTAPDLPTVSGDATHLVHALQEIIDNACRFTPDDGQITVNAESADDYVRIEIRDNGPGIPQDVMPHIFETFWRQDTAHSTPGFGLGLPIARKIIEHHGGEISVNSRESEGTTVHIRLPVVATTA